MTSKVYVALRVRATPERARLRPSPARSGSGGGRAACSRPRRAHPAVWPSKRPAGIGVLIETLANGKVFEIGKVLAWDPPALLIFSWRQAAFPPDHSHRSRGEVRGVGEETASASNIAASTGAAESAARHRFPDHALLARLSEFWQAQLRSVGDRVA
jgi:hypothetical protein